MIATWRPIDGGLLEFEAQAAGVAGFADGAHYLAVGFSRDGEMGDDTAIITSGDFANGNRSVSETDLFWNEDHEGSRWVEDGFSGTIEFQELVEDASATEFIYVRWTR